MRLVKSLAFIFVALALIAGLLWYAGDRLETLGKVVRLARGLMPDSVEADDATPPEKPEAPTAPEAAPPPEASAKPPGITDVTQDRLARIKLGMTREQVDGILGQCAFAKTQCSSDGTRVCTAMWTYDSDMVGVRFHNGAVVLVIGSRLAAMSEATSPAATGGDGGKPAVPGNAKHDSGYTRHWLELEEQIKKRSDPEELLLKLFGERPDKQ